MTVNNNVIRANGATGIYVHIPFCIRKCNYCAFLSGPSSEEERVRYVDALVKEIGLAEILPVAGGDWQTRPSCDTVFIGGGTPSILPASEIGRILDAIRAHFDISEDAEITMEANPATLTAEKLGGYRAVGVNRLSIGVQSFDDEVLKRLGRIHTREEVIREYELAREAGFTNINFDLMFGIPGTDVAGTLSSLREAIALAPEHISYYSLQLEEGTKFWQDFVDGTLKEVPDDTDREMYHKGRMLLKESGYEHYEISNFAKPGFRSRHNFKYWSMADYYGFGLGASSYVRGTRIMNVRDMDKYCAAVDAGRLPQGDIYVNSEHDDISEAVFTGLRRNFGIRFEDILGSKEAFYEYYKAVIPKLEDFERTGHVLLTEEGITLTNLGIDVSNQIMALFV